MNFKNIKLAISPLTWSNDDLPELGANNTFEQCVSEMTLAGYEGCEIGVKFPRKIDLLKPALELRNLVVCNQWFSFRFTQQPFNQVKNDFIRHLDFLDALGASIVGGAEVGNSIQGNQQLGVFSQKPFFDEQQWKTISQYFNQIGQIALDRGFRFCYHHHMGTVIQTQAEVDRFMEMTDERYVFLNYDSGHFYFSGEDPIKLLKKYLSRIKHIHLKDIRVKVFEEVKKNDDSFLKSVFKGVFTIPGDGVIDFTQLFQILKNNYQGWLVVEAEQDPIKANPLTYAIRSRSYLKSQIGI